MVVVLGVLSKDSVQMPLPKYNHMVSAFSADGANDSLNEGVLPWGTKPGRDVFDPQSP